MSKAETGSRPAVLESREGSTCYLTLNRPAKLNALNDDVRVGLQSSLLRIADDSSARIVVLQGAGRCFSAGADLASGTPAITDWAARRHAAGGWQRLMALLESVPQVTVARLHGHVIGGGVLLAASCDIRVGDPTVQLRIPELAIGVPLTWAGNPRLAREIGLARAREWVMTGRRIDATEAWQAGFLQRLAPEGGLDAAVDAVVTELSAMPAGPLAMTRASFNAIGAAAGHLEIGWADPDLIAWSGTELESREAAASYVQRRLGGRSGEARS